MKALILTANGVEDLELFYPYYRFKEEGLEVDVAGGDFVKGIDDGDEGSINVLLRDPVRIEQTAGCG